MNVLLIKNGIVENCISADSVQLALEVYPGHICLGQLGSEGIGYTYDGTVFTAPPAPTAPPQDKRITQYAFLSRFTDSEAVGIDLASQGATMQAATMRRMQKKIDSAVYIDLSDLITRSGVESLEAYGLLSVGRAAEILDAPVASNELYEVKL